MSELRHLLSEESPSIRSVLKELERGADPNAVSLDAGVSAMHLAAGLGKEVMGYLIQYGGDPNIRSQERMTPLHVAASYGDLETLTLLLHNGANANLQDEDGNRPFDLAMENGHPLCIEELKIHTMLASVEDCSGYKRSCQNEEGCYNSNSNLSYFDNSCIDPEVLENKYAKAITQEVYDYLSEGKRICFDATSPTTPLVGLKNSCRKTCHTCEMGPKNCGVHCSSESLNHGHIYKSHSSERLNPESNHLHHSSANVHRPAYVSHSPQRIIDPSTCMSCSPLKANHDCLSLSSQRMNCELPQMANHSSSCVLHSPQRENCVSTCPSHLCQSVAQEPACLSYSSQRMNHGSPYSSYTHSPQRINHGSPHSSHTPQRMNHGSPHSSHTPQRMNHGSSYSSHSPQIMNHHGSPHSSHTSQRMNHGSSYSSHSPQRMNHHGSPHSSHTPQRINPGSPYSPSLKRNEQESTNLSSPQILKSENTKNNVSPSQIRNFIHSPKKDHTFFPPVCPISSLSANENDCYLQRTVINESGDCPLTFSDRSHNCQKTSHSNIAHSKMPKTADENFGNSYQEPVSKKIDVEKCPHNEYLSSGSSNQSVSSSLSRVAEYVLSCTDFSSQCSVDSTSKINPPCHPDISSESLKEEKENLVPNENVSRNSIASSSCDSFCTAENNSCSSSPNSAVNNKSSNSAYHMHDNALFTKNSSPSSKGELLCSQIVLPKQWQLPTLTQTNALDDSIMTSESSFLITNKNKIFPADRVDIEDKYFEHHKMSNKNSELRKKRRELGYGLLLPKVCNIQENEALCLNNSLLSAMSTEEFLHTDPESGITLVERWLPSDCGSSIVSSRRSLESLNSKLSQDSQATMIYDWKTLKQVSKPDNCDDSDLTISIQNNSYHSVKDDESEDTVIPLHLKRLSNEQLSQELQKFGEIPGPIIAATRQAYLKRLTSLEAEPGLVRITKTSPDFPNELRQAMNGLFDWSDMSDLEMKMVDNFATSQGRQWREGCAKSSFTYLLLDPRVTCNLPLRVKDLSELEVFKSFICGIFYIGKGKRARPYCHLYEAVSKMNKNGCKRSEKVQHILDIWKCNLGVISLHCFQSVIPVEAYTREACMLEAIGMHKVTNVKRGDFYGIVSTWPMQQRRKLGVYFLHKAMTIFLAEGERQICLPDLKSNSQ